MSGDLIRIRPKARLCSRDQRRALCSDTQPQMDNDKGVMPMVQLAHFIGDCQVNEAVAWQRLCAVIDRASRYRIRPLLKANCFDASLDDDVLQELYSHLSSRSCSCLRLFQGTTDRELRAFLGTVAYRFATKLIARWRRLRAKEEMAAPSCGKPDRDGPTQAQIENAYREVMAVMPVADHEKLHHLCQHTFPQSPVSGTPSASTGTVPERTLRRWRADFCRKYADWL